MENKLINFFILADIFIVCYIIITLLLSWIFPASDEPGIVGLFVMGAPWLLIIIFLIVLVTTRNRSLNKNDSPIISIASVILFIGFLYFILFSFGVDVGAHPLSRLTKSKVVCSMILVDSARERCMVNVSVLRGDNSSCATIVDTEKKYQCFWRVAEKTLDIKLCESAGRYTDMCVMAVAKGTKNKQYCDLMPAGGTFSKDYCVNSVK